MPAGATSTAFQGDVCGENGVQVGCAWLPPVSNLLAYMATHRGK